MLDALPDAPVDTVIGCVPREVPAPSPSRPRRSSLAYADLTLQALERHGRLGEFLDALTARCPDDASRELVARLRSA